MLQMCPGYSQFGDSTALHNPGFRKYCKRRQDHTMFAPYAHGMRDSACGRRRQLRGDDGASHGVVPASRKNIFTLTSYVLCIFLLALTCPFQVVGDAPGPRPSAPPVDEPTCIPETSETSVRCCMSITIMSTLTAMTCSCCTRESPV